MQGDTVYLVITGGSHDDNQFKVFGSKEDAEEEFHIWLEEALAYDDEETLDTLPEYTPRRSFLAKNGDYCEVVALEVE